MADVYGILSEILECDIGKNSHEINLENIDTWDSVAMLSVIAMSDDELGVEVDISQLSGVRTIGDLVKLMEK